MAGKPADARDAHIGQRIDRLRTLARMSRRTLAERIGLSASQLDKYEKGVNRVSATDLDRIARVFGVPIGHFFEELPAEGARPPGFGERPQPTLAEAAATRFARDVARAADAHLPPDDRQRLAVLVGALDRALNATEAFDKENSSGSSG
ncbi:MAG: helix-turn-helix domain-containing protein [Methylobacterium sp.]|uniref:helix-turn-helix domain-containing protein n=1 Tax=Methylobacterium sp. TaxID=409 RepID=UPI00258823ED|nr:helix-turn-helix transcriptional regulator [Methylobacterium sp.]MBY0297332.1 helix-turn-helix domain-containing protein [Methylobacterium sp.]